MTAKRQASGSQACLATKLGLPSPPSAVTTLLSVRAYMCKQYIKLPTHIFLTSQGRSLPLKKEMPNTELCESACSLSLLTMQIVNTTEDRCKLMVNVCLVL